MKRLIIIIISILLIAGLFLPNQVSAQAPEKISYQAVIRDASNELVSNQTIGIQISILQGNEEGLEVFVETHSQETNDNGLVSLEIGGGTINSGDFSTIDWANDTYFLKTDIDPEGGTSYTITSISQLISVPYAFHAHTADSLIGGLTFPESDPVFSSSISYGITAQDIDNWNDHTIDTDTHIDSAGIADLGFVAGPHTIDTDTQIDSTGIAALGFVAGPHTVEVDGSTTNELQTLSTSGDTIFISNGNYILLPGLAYIGDLIPSPVVYHEFTTGNQIDLTQVSTGWTYNSVDFVNGIITLNAGSDPSVPQFLSDDGGANYGYLRFNATTSFRAYTVSSATQTVAEGSTIDNSIAFSTSDSEISGSFANWGDVSNVFIPIYLTISSEVHYGYMKVSFVDNPGLFTIHAIAYNSNVGEAIIAGDTGD